MAVVFLLYAMDGGVNVRLAIMQLFAWAPSFHASLLHVLQKHVYTITMHGNMNCHHPQSSYIRSSCSFHLHTPSFGDLQRARITLPGVLQAAPPTLPFVAKIDTAARFCYKSSLYCVCVGCKRVTDSVGHVDVLQSLGSTPSSLLSCRVQGVWRRCEGSHTGFAQQD